MGTEGYVTQSLNSAAYFIFMSLGQSFAALLFLSRMEGRRRVVLTGAL